MSQTEGMQGTGQPKTKLYAFGVAFVASVGGFLFGYDLAIVCGANLYLKDVFHLSDAAFGFATGSAALGCIIGPFIGGWLCDFMGRNRTMIFACILLGIGSVLTAIPNDIVTFNIFRIVGGIGVGLCSIASPMYISEIAPPRMRGGLGVMYQLAIVVGSIAAPGISYLLVRFTPEAVCWRWMFASELLPVIVFVILLAMLPQSPRWLAQRGRYEEALAVLTKVDSPEFAKEEMIQIKSSLKEEKGSFAELFSPGIRYAFGIGILLAFFNNWTGWSAMGGYIPMLFQQSGLDDRAIAFLKFTLTYATMGVITLIACWTVDLVGRRPLWLFGSALMAVVTALTGLVFHFHMSGWPVLVVLMLCAIPHGLALGPLPWLMMSEIFPTHLRARAVSLTTAFLWVTIFSGAQLFPIITGFTERHFGSVGGAFWLFTIICIAAFLFGWRMLPETKGRTLEEISASWKKT
ncbi:MAG TPA: sugar porter family MFS transporter [Candidatus Hydrogenedentes bacterium]|nr:sugar porter family MFS transporter [Candidatus Hydrogenedentota bacterium]